MIGRMRLSAGRGAVLGVGLGAVLAVALPAVAAAGDFQVAFSWGKTPACSGGTPALVTNPRFVLDGVPAGTRALTFEMLDLNAPGFHHGGGRVRYKGQVTIEPGAFSYLGPCPPKGSHRYMWVVEARNGTGVFAKRLAVARASLAFPK